VAMTVLPEDTLKLLLAVVLGGLIGAEREYRDRAAGFRTIILICTGATLFTLFSLKIGGAQDPVRIAASIVSGVGFLGAGAILRGPGRIAGLTTASTIWLAAALGVGIGGGHYLLAGMGAVLALIVLAVFPRVEDWIDNLRHIRTYKVSCAAELALYAQLEDVIRGCGLRARRGVRSKVGDKLTCTWDVWGPPEGHDRLMEKLLAHADVQDFEA
jgi:putative Mg2+ transporter-C (MgtC) family protein